MPSPFPGMDPYLEGSFWTSFHAQLGSEVSRQLSPKVRPKYTAMTVQRFVMDDPEDVAISTSSIYPDVALAEHGSGAPEPHAASIAAPVELDTVMPERVPHYSVEIRDAANRQLVTPIEILSPTIKRGEGRQEYLSKRRRILLSSSHLVEIDLLRTGTRLPVRGELPAADYFVFVSREERRPMTHIWPISVRDVLPDIPVPLLEPDADVVLELQLAFDTIYDAVGYSMAIDYGQPPERPLSEVDTAWAKELIQSGKESSK